MWSFNRNFWRSTLIRAPKILFLGEQDGASERALKIRLTQLLGCGQSVRRAYLALLTRPSSASPRSLPLPGFCHSANY